MRMQGEEESVGAYVQDVIYLCTKVNNQISERSKIKHVLRGLKPSLLEKVMVRTNNSLNELLTNIRKIQTARFMAGQRVDNLLGDPIRETNPVGYRKGPEPQMASKNLGDGPPNTTRHPKIPVGRGAYRFAKVRKNREWPTSRARGHLSWPKMSLGDFSTKSKLSSRRTQLDTRKFRSAEVHIGLQKCGKTENGPRLGQEDTCPGLKCLLVIFRQSPNYRVTGLRKFLGLRKISGGSYRFASEAAEHNSTPENSGRPRCISVCKSAEKPRMAHAAEHNSTPENSGRPRCISVCKSAEKPRMAHVSGKRTLVLA
ncbi:hypothetical protein J6590_099152 [Homalodisca vitripennis]|nr:hypothetical protein J6590_099152 [Homalodisca vitripennis]